MIVCSGKVKGCRILLILMEKGISLAEYAVEIYGRDCRIVSGVLVSDQNKRMNGNSNSNRTFFVHFFTVN